MKVKFKIGELKLKVDENEIKINNLECESEMNEEELNNYTSYCLGLFTNSFEMINNTNSTDTDMDLSSYTKKVKKEFELNKERNNQNKDIKFY